MGVGVLSGKGEGGRNPAGAKLTQGIGTLPRFQRHKRKTLLNFWSHTVRQRDKQCRDSRARVSGSRRACGRGWRPGQGGGRHFCPREGGGHTVSEVPLSPESLMFGGGS